VPIYAVFEISALAAEGQGSKFVSWESGGVSVIARSSYDLSLYGVLMDVVFVMSVVLSVSNPMVGEPALPDFPLSAQY